MTAAVVPFRVDTIKRHGDDHVGPYIIRRPLLANAQPYQFYLVTGQASSGLFCGVPAVAAPNTFLLGASDRDITTPGATDGGASVFLYQQWLIGFYQSTIVGDAFIDTDFGTVAFTVDNQTFGKKSNDSGTNRSIGAIFAGIDADEQNKAEFMIGPMYTLLARAVHVTEHESAGSIAYAVDASASTDQGSAADPVLIPRKPIHGHITSIEIIPRADLAASGGTDNAALTIYKIDTLTNTVSAAIGTFTTSTQALAKRTPTQFTLTGTSTLLDMLETDVLGYARLHNGAGAVIPQSIIRANMKVQ